MSLLTRLSRLFQSDFHAVLDCVEEPVALLKQAVREMSDCLSSDERRLMQLTQELEQLADRRAACVRQMAQIAEALDICFAAGDEDLARGLLRRRLESESVDQCAAAQIEVISRAERQLKTRIDENRPRLTAMRQKLAMLAEENSTCGLRPGPFAASSAVSDAEIEIALLREKQQRAQS